MGDMLDWFSSADTATVCEETAARSSRRARSSGDGRLFLLGHAHAMEEDEGEGTSEVEIRDWVGMPSDALFVVLGKLDVDDILTGAGRAGRRLNMAQHGDILEVEEAEAMAAPPAPSSPSTRTPSSPTPSSPTSPPGRSPRLSPPCFTPTI
ncbi:hypothetical protein ZWY2020_048694 [Hordeum vulgare]|nr:hypothetical protein ZWY2020_048694 [Hordeum vulgare]